MSINEAFRAYLRTLEREHRDFIIQEQSAFAASMSKINAVGSSQFPQGMANIARRAALDYARKSSIEAGLHSDLNNDDDFAEVSHEILAFARQLLAIGTDNTLQPVLNQPANALRALTARELDDEVRDRLVLARTKGAVTLQSPTTPWNLLFLVSNPNGEPVLDTNVEYRETQSAIREADYRDQVNLVLEPATRIRDIIRATNRHRPRVIHFSGHGNDRCLALLDESNQVKQFDAQFLANILADDDQVELVVLNSCHSLPQAKKLLPFVPHVVGTTHDLNDQAALIFSHTFYGALMYGRTIAGAYNQAIARIQAELSASEAVYRLCTAPGRSPGPLTSVVSSSSVQDRSDRTILSHWEKEILRYVPKSGDIHILENDRYGKWVQVGTTDFRGHPGRTVAAEVLDALDALVTKKLVHHNVGAHYTLTGKGWALKEDLGLLADH